MPNAQDGSKPGSKSAAPDGPAKRGGEDAGRKLAPSPSRPRTKTSPEKQKVPRSEDPFAKPAKKPPAAPDAIAREHASRARVKNATDSSSSTAQPKPSGGWDSTPAAPPPQPKPDANRHKQPKAEPPLRASEVPAASPASPPAAKVVKPPPPTASPPVPSAGKPSAGAPEGTGGPERATAAAAADAAKRTPAVGAADTSKAPPGKAPSSTNAGDGTAASAAAPPVKRAERPPEGIAVPPVKRGERAPQGAAAGDGKAAAGAARPAKLDAGPAGHASSAATAKVAEPVAAKLDARPAEHGSGAVTAKAAESAAAPSPSPPKPPTTAPPAAQKVASQKDAPPPSPAPPPAAAAEPQPRKIAKSVSMAQHMPRLERPLALLPPLPPPEPERRVLGDSTDVAPFNIPLPMIELVRCLRPAVQRHLLHAVLRLPTDAVAAEHKPLLAIADLSVPAQREAVGTPEELANEAALTLPRRARERRRSRRQRAYALMSDPSSSRAAQVVSVVILVAIVASTTAHCYSTMPGVPSSPVEAAVLANTERVTTALFTAEYLIRLVTCDSVVAFLLNVLNTIDLCAILPFYVELILDSALGSTRDLSITRTLRVVRLIRVFRVLKVGAQYKKLEVISAVVTQSRDILGVLVFMLTLAVLLFSSLTYYSEQIDSELLHTSSVPSPFTSIPGTFWWCMVTLSTIGYGDQIPVTALGKVTAGVSMVCAIVIMALPISVIGTQFTQRWASFSKQHKREMRTAVAFETLSRVVDNMVDHVKVMQDFAAAERVCDLRLRHCLTELHACVQQVELAYAAGMGGGRSPKDAAALAKSEIPRLRKALTRAKRSHLELRALLQASQCGNDETLTVAVSELFTSYQQLTKWYEESHFLLDDYARMRRQMQTVKKGIYEGAGKASIRAGSQQQS